MTTTAEPDTEERTYSSPEACNLTGATYRQLDYWCRSGRLGDDSAHGSGSRRSLTLEQVEVVRYAVDLQRAGFALDPALEVAQKLVAGGMFSCKVGEIHEVVICVVAVPPRAGLLP